MTGVGMMDCKKALEENQGDLDKAVVWLREKGMARAAKKSGRTAAEGMVVLAVSPDNKRAALVELNCETDFSGKNEEFQSFANKLAPLALASQAQTVEALESAKINDTQTVKDALLELITKVGENMNLRRLVLVQADYVTGYSHMGGKIGTLVHFETKDPTSPKLSEVGADLAMHVAACTPKYFDASQVPTQELEQEKAIARKKLEEEGRPANMIEKILGGQVTKFYKEVCFVDQAFVKEPKQSVLQYVKDSGSEATLKGFVRFQLGEGIDVKKENFADEVAAQLNR
jgi:elongation factor Ts